MIKNRTIFTGDNLPILRGMDSESVDLIYLDPPFNSNRHYSAPIGSKAAGAGFKDVWTFEDTDTAWWGELAKKHETLYRVIDVAGAVGGEGNEAYLIYMAMRLLELRRILKPTGSIYLHCDPTMSHPLKMAMDALFGYKNFLNELIWYYRGAGVPKNKRAKRHDILLYYAKKIGSHYFNPNTIRRSYAEATIKRFKHQIGNVRGGHNYGNQQLNPLGKHPDDVITDIQPVAPSAKDRLGYPTQKPLKLLDEIIKSSSQKAEIVLDPFCGCATTCIAAEFLQRNWIGIDISPLAAKLVVERAEREIGGLFPIIHRTDIPIRNAPPPSKNSLHVHAKA